MAEVVTVKPNNEKASQPNEILCTLDTMRKCGDLTDTVIHVCDQTFKVHRAILACSSEYFRAMFTSNLCESINGIVHFHNQIDPQIFSLLLDYSYTTDITVTDINVQDLLEAACHLQYKKVIDVCCDFLIDKLDPSNCLGFQKFSESLSLWNLYKKSQGYALEHFSEVVTCEEYHQLTVHELQEYLSSDQLNVDKEESTYKAIFSWIKSNHKHELLPSLLSCVRLPFTRPDFLLEQLDNPLIKHNPECSNMLRNARTSQLQLREKYLSDSTLVPRCSTKSEVVVVVGGYSYDHKCVRDVFYYNPLSNRWGILTRLPNLDIFGFAVGALKNCIYITGGMISQKFSNKVYCYHVDQETWQLCQNFITPRINHSSIGHNGYLYIFGGNSGNEIIDTVERFCPDRNQWEVVESLPIAVSSPVVVCHEDKIYVIGGSRNQANHFHYMQCYDTINNKWNIIRTISIYRQMCPVAVVGDHIYILSASGMMRVYDIKSDNLLKSNQVFDQTRSLHAAVAVKGCLYIAASNHATSGLATFDPRLKKWMEITTTPSGVKVNGHWLAIHKYLGPPFSSK